MTYCPVRIPISGRLEVKKLGKSFTANCTSTKIVIMTAKPREGRKNDTYELYVGFCGRTRKKGLTAVMVMDKLEVQGNFRRNFGRNRKEI